MMFESVVPSFTALVRQITTAELRNTPRDTSSTANLIQPSFPLLSLPLELRLQIHRYLCPNVYCDGLYQTPKVLRTDGVVCSPSIFLINRQLYAEVREEWYGHVYYRARIHPTGFHLHGCVWSLYRELPRTLGYIKNLDLEVQLESPGSMLWATHRKEPIGLYCCTEFLEKCARDGRMDKLRKLKLGFGVSSACLEYYRDRIGDLRADLEREMKGLRGLKGLAEVQFTGTWQGCALHNILPEETSRSSATGTLHAMTKIMAGFVDELAEAIRG